jgi:hypothetical protein
MASIELSVTWTASGSPTAARTRLAAFFHHTGMRVVGEQSGEVYVRRGWRLARLLGRLAPGGWLPVRAVVRLTRRADGVGVRACIEEGYPSEQANRRMGEQYRTHFAEWMRRLRFELQ